MVNKSKGKKVVPSTTVKMVKYKTIETTRGTKTKLVKLPPFKKHKEDKSSQGSSSKSKSSVLHGQPYEDAPSYQYDEDNDIPFQTPKHKVIPLLL